MPDLTTLLLTDHIDKVWSDEAREAALEARRAAAKGKVGIKQPRNAAEDTANMMRESRRQRAAAAAAKPAAKPAGLSPEGLTPGHQAIVDRERAQAKEALRRAADRDAQRAKEAQQREDDFYRQREEQALERFAGEPQPGGGRPERTFRATAETTGFDFDRQEDVRIRPGELLIPTEASDKGTVFRRENGREVHIRSGDDYGIVEHKEKPKPPVAKPAAPKSQYGKFRY